MKNAEVSKQFDEISVELRDLLSLHVRRDRNVQDLQPPSMYIMLENFLNS